MECVPRFMLSPQGCPARRAGWGCGATSWALTVWGGIAEPSLCCSEVLEAHGEPSGRGAQSRAQARRGWAAGRHSALDPGLQEPEGVTHGLAFGSPGPRPAFGSFHTRTSRSSVVALIALRRGDSSARQGHGSRLGLSQVGPRLPCRVGALSPGSGTERLVACSGHGAGEGTRCPSCLPFLWVQRALGYVAAAG